MGGNTIPPQVRACVEEESEASESAVVMRLSVKRFAAAMEAELAANDHKGGWEHDSAGALLRRLAQEVEELRRALQKRVPARLAGGREHHRVRSELQAAVLSEAADIANFAMMIAEQYDPEG